ncbi:hypothetical protein TPHA_0L01960 [Tetrapisispora phaffii CBS 4417]|uniref:Uncharacterized protein n=1 Tax=Tetrapisispora phaffii (strain ATCC 24235 / CBS 4417 / NBRC 1672 / NRRL Y-8282 / UCD 70-5) TaxID=1071381 RepID=G8C070_TETPH|nr:hypothetical protein TPHA_0L01960 [Tetrapisispora phaffii CBS 4417]CCE65548.1 hypothetical protein TPHA_0L01960 [Tetrapisispora phaffii CBS 4417]
MLGYTRLNTLLRYQTRNYRLKRTTPASHIFRSNQVNDNAIINKQTNTNFKPEEISKLNFKGLGLEHLNTSSLKDGFESALVLDYLNFTKSPYNRSSKNLNKLKKHLQDTTDEKKKFNLLFDFLLEESNIEINQHQKLGIEGSQLERLDNQKMIIENEKEDPTAIFQELIMSKEKEDPNLKSFANFKFVLYLLDKLEQNFQKTTFQDIPITIPQLVNAFETAKLLPIDTLRSKGIYLTGNLLYASNKVRLDPVNESFYINALVNYGKFKKAYSLFASYKDKCSERWWYELGLMLFLTSNSLKKFDRLLVEFDSKFNESTYLSPKVLVFGIKKKVYIHDTKSTVFLTNRFINMINEFGYKGLRDKDDLNSKKSRFFRSEDQAYEFLNEKQLLSIYDIVKVLSYLTYKQNIPIAYKILNALITSNKVDNINLKYLIKSTRMNLLASPSEFVEELRRAYKRDANCKTDSFAKFQILLKETQKELNINNNFPELLYEDFKSLVKHPALNQLIFEFVTETEKNDHLSQSKQLYELIKYLLSNNEYNKAILLLKKMELKYSEYRQSNMSTTNDNNNDKFLNAHHYALLLEYFYLKCRKGDKAKVEKYSAKISEIIDNLEKNEIPINCTFLAKLLKFYTDNRDFNNCFQIINQSLAAKLEKMNETHRFSTFYERRVITKNLYIEICKAYLRYYRVLIAHKEYAAPKSNIFSWNSMVLKLKSQTFIHPQFSHRQLFSIMTEGDTLLFDQILYKLFIRLFIIAGDWPGLIGAIYYISEKYGLKLTMDSKEYILKGLETVYIEKLSGYKTGDSGILNNERVTQATIKVRQMIKSDKLLWRPKQQSFSNDSIIEEILCCMKFIDNDIESWRKNLELTFQEFSIEETNITKLIKRVNS